MTLKSISDWTVTDASASLGPRLDRSNRAEPKSSSHVSCLILFSDSLVVDVNRLKDPFCFVLVGLWRGGSTDKREAVFGFYSVHEAAADGQEEEDGGGEQTANANH